MEKGNAKPAHLRDIKNLVGTSTTLFSSNIFSKDLLGRMKEHVEKSDDSAPQVSGSATRISARKKEKPHKYAVDTERDSDEDCVVLSQSSTESIRRNPPKRSRRLAKSAAADTESSQYCDETSKETLQILKKLEMVEKVECVEVSDDSSDSITCLDEQGSPAKKEKLVIVVRCQSRLFNYSMSPEAPLSDILEKVADECHVDVSQVTLIFNSRPVRPENTPEGLNLASADILECVITKYREMGKAENTICIKFQCSKRRNENIEVSLVKPLREGAKVLAERLGLPLSQLTFKFDGECVDLKSTPQELGIESNDCVDVCIKG